MVREAREVVLQRDPHEALPLRVIERAMAFEIDIETGRRRGDKNIERLARGGEGPRNRARGRQGPVHRSGEQRAGVDFNYLMRARLHESGGWPALHVACVKRCAAAPGAMRIGEVRNLDSSGRPAAGRW